MVTDPDPIFAPDRLVNGRYRLAEQLGEGGMGRVYRAFDRLSGEWVALKQISTPAGNEPTPLPLTFSDPQASSDPRVTLAREFQAMSTLRHPHILGVLDYGFAEGQPYFTMELLEKAPTILEYGLDKPLPERVALLIQVLRALIYIHRRGLLHRDLKPGNILIVNDQVKVLDFGLSVDIDQATGTVGTLAYMPPEVLYGRPAGPASDLYTFGIVAYQLLTGQHPFTGRFINNAFLIDRILSEPPDLSNPAIPPAIALVLARLLAKEKKERYQEATTVIHALGQAMGQVIPLDTEETRESLLQAARFVGREEEMSQLRAALTLALSGRGTAWLVGGESGVGKSRLLDELRTLALVRGALVLRSLAIANGNSPYLLWRGVLRWLALLSDLTDLEASVLKPLVPDIANLIEREVADPPTLNPADAQIRLFAIIYDIFSRQKQPIVIILEDLQWAEMESLLLLAWLIRTVPSQSLLIVGNFRDDERPDLPETLPTAQLLKLKRLPPQAIASLSESMLGSVGRLEGVVSLLERETEGNPFFVVEVVRVLVEEAGQMDRISHKSLPQRVFTGGVGRLVQRRLEQLPPAGRPLLQLAAVIGRQLDLKLLQALEPATNVQGWLTMCANVAVLEVQDEGWRFAHDKLREGVLAGLPAGQRAELHRQVAITLERLYPDQPDYAPTLAYHWKMVGDQQKEAYFAAQAGTQALRSGANQAAVNFLKRALELDPLGNGRSPLEQLRLMRQFGQAYLGLGQLHDSLRVLEQVLIRAGWPVPVTKWQLAGSLLWQLLTQAAHRLRPGWFTGRANPAHKEILLEATRAYQQVAEIYYFASQREMLFNAGLRALNLSEKAGPSPELARAYGNMTVIMGLLRRIGLAEAYSQRAIETAEKSDNAPALAWALITTGTYALGQAQWQRVIDVSEKAIALCLQVGDKRVLGLCYGVRALASYHQGLLTEGRGIYEQQHITAFSSNNIQQQTLGLVGKAQSLLRLGYTGEAVDLIKQSSGLILTGYDRGEDYPARFREYGIRAWAHLHREEWEEARQMADSAMGIANHVSRPGRIEIVEGVVAVTVTYLTLWEVSRDSGEYLVITGRALKLLKQYGKVFITVRPAALLAEGVYEWLLSRPDKATQRLQQALALAQQLGMAFEEGFAFYYLGRYASDPALARQYLAQARAIFQRIQAAHHLQQTEREIANRFSEN